MRSNDALDPATSSSGLAPIHEVLPDVAARLDAGVTFQVSRKTLAEFAAEHQANAVQRFTGAASSPPASLNGFGSVHEVLPEVARRLAPGLTFQVSRKTFAQIAEDKRVERGMATVAEVFQVVLEERPTADQRSKG